MNVQEIFENMPPQPKKVEKDILNNLVCKTYVIYDRKADIATCTRCGKSFPADKVPGKHNTETVCPHCKSKAILKSIGKGRDNIEENLRLLVFTRRGKDVYACLNYIDIKFTPIGKPQIVQNLSNVYYFGKNEQKRFRRKYYLGKDFGWSGFEEINTMSLPPAVGCGFISRYQYTCVYMGNLKDVFLNSNLKYLYDLDLIRKLDSAELIKYVFFGLKYQSIELLYKAGFERLVLQKLTGMTSSSINWRGKSLCKILKLPPRQVRQLQKHNPGLHEFDSFVDLGENDRDTVPWKMVLNLNGIFDNNDRKEFIERVKSHTTLAKVSDYIDTLAVKGHGEYRSTSGALVLDYMDYIKMINNIGMDMNRKDVLFPKDFHKAHDKATKQYKANKSKILSANMKKNALEISYSNTKLMTLEAVSQKQLNEESKQLCHCVRIYGDKVANGSTHIFFIRKKNKPDKSFYTLEVSPTGQLVQCRGKHNCSMTEEVKEFVDAFMKVVTKELKKEKRKIA